MRAAKLISLYDRNRHGHPPIPYHFCNLNLLCEILLSEEPEPRVDAAGVGVFGEENLPSLYLTRVIPTQISCFFEHHHNPNLLRTSTEPTVGADFTIGLPFCRPLIAATLFTMLQAPAIPLPCLRKSEEGFGSGSGKSAPESPRKPGAFGGGCARGRGSGRASSVI